MVVRRERGGCLVVVTAGGLLSDGGELARLRSHFSLTVVVSLGGPVPPVPGARVVRAATAQDAVRRWNAVIAK